MNELEFTGINIGGICSGSIKLLDVDDLTSMPIPIKNEIKSAVGDPGDWKNFPVQDQQSDITEIEVSAGGRAYKLVLTANIRKQSGTKSLKLYELTKKKFLIDFTDQNGYRRIAGTMDEGISMHVVRNETRRQAKEPNEYQIEFRAVRRWPIPYYNPA
jgi:hypothetical protein